MTTRLTYFATIELRALHVAIGTAVAENTMNDAERVAAVRLREQIGKELDTRVKDEA